METTGLVIWARAGVPSLIVWCADSGALAYVPDRRTAGDPHAALAVGDMVKLTLDMTGTVREGKDLRYHGAGAGWVMGEIAREAGPRGAPVMSRDAAVRALIQFDPGRMQGMANGGGRGSCREAARGDTSCRGADGAA